MKKFKNTILLLTLLSTGFATTALPMKNNQNVKVVESIAQKKQNNYYKYAAPTLAATLSIASALLGPKLSKNGTPISGSQDAIVVVARTIVITILATIIVKCYDSLQHMKQIKRQTKQNEQEEIQNQIDELKKTTEILTKTVQQQAETIANTRTIVTTNFEIIKGLGLKNEQLKKSQNKMQLQIASNRRVMQEFMTMTNTKLSDLKKNNTSIINIVIPKEALEKQNIEELIKNLALSITSQLSNNENQQNERVFTIENTDNTETQYETLLLENSNKEIVEESQNKPSFAAKIALFTTAAVAGGTVIIVYICLTQDEILPRPN